MVNAGTIAALQGNLNLATLSTNNLNLSNVGGTLTALNGAINFGNLSNTNNVNTSISGGNLLSQNLNIYSGTGTVDVNVDNVSGAVNVFAGAAHVVAATPDLTLGQCS